MEDPIQCAQTTVPQCSQCSQWHCKYRGKQSRGEAEARALVAQECTLDGNEKRALVIGIDGLRADGIHGAAACRMVDLLGRSAWTFHASTQMTAPTLSGPGWASILTGMEASKHGVYGNDDCDRIDRRCPTLLARAKALGLSTMTAVNWEPIHTQLIESGVVDAAMVGTDAEVAATAVESLRRGSHHLHFVHFDDVDSAGHETGFTTQNPRYVEAIRTTDVYVGRLLDAIAARPTRSHESWLVVLTSDHGGSGTDHGAKDADNRTIPLVVFGDMVVTGELGFASGDMPGALNVGFISHLDVHPTIMAHLGFPSHDDLGLDGHVLGCVLPAQQDTAERKPELTPRVR
jgi:predicted AlkP superfamily pyrophosphatase or phosphodiesterase